MPKSAARSEPTASMTARTSSIRCSSVGISDTRSESPVPGLSNRMSRAKDASRWKNRAPHGSSHWASETAFWVDCQTGNQIHF
jgi:hypothetical protein